MRAYAATARGGVWYTGDGGATWAPVGAWAEPARTVGGSNLADACGCILVNFGATSAQDFVMVGTGEINPVELAHGEWTSGGVGVLCALDPVGRAAVNPWEPDAGLAQLENLGIYRLARHPAARAGSAAGATQDVVVAATSNGLYIGRRQPLPAVVGPPPLPARDGFVWTQAADVSWQGPITDVLFLPGGRLVACAVGVGLVVSDDLATTAAVPVASVAGLGLWPAPPPSGCRSRLPLGEDPGQSIGEGLPVQARLQLGVVCRTPPRAALLRLLGAEGLEVLGGLRARGPAAQTGARLAGHGCASSVRGLGPTRIQPSWTSCGILGR